MGSSLTAPFAAGAVTAYPACRRALGVWPGIIYATECIATRPYLFGSVPIKI